MRSFISVADFRRGAPKGPVRFSVNLGEEASG
jgi:hypothetical protein